MPHPPDSHPHATPPVRWLRIGGVALYGLMIAGAVALFFAIDASGSRLTAPDIAHMPTAAGTRPPKAADPIVHVLVALTAVLIAGRALALVFRHFGQPPVIGEVV